MNLPNNLQIEKWVTFFILSFILIIAAFNVVGPLSILIIEKKNDIKILQCNMTAPGLWSAARCSDPLSPR